MSQSPNEYGWQDEDKVVGAIVGWLQTLNGVWIVERESFSFAAMYQEFVRITLMNGMIFRLCIGYVYDDENLDAFDSNFVSRGDMRRHGEVAHGAREGNGDRPGRRRVKEQEELCLRLRRLHLG